MKHSTHEFIGFKGIVRVILEDIYTGEKDVTEYKNLIPTVGREAICRRLVFESAIIQEGVITYGAVGTGTDVPVNGDTQLQTELARKQVSSRNFSANVITVRTFFTASEAVGALKEFGLFGEDATGAADSGTLFQRVNIDKTKTASKTLTIESIITLT